jgi:hypothetical protein
VEPESDDPADGYLDDEAWNHALTFWRRELAALATEIGSVGEWSTIVRPETWDGELWIHRDIDDQTICAGYSRSLDRGFKVQQFPAHRAEGLISAWLYTERPEGSEGIPDVPQAFLMVVIELSEETAAVAGSLLRRFMSAETTIPEMEAFIDETFPPDPDAEDPLPADPLDGLVAAAIQEVDPDAHDVARAIATRLHGGEPLSTDLIAGALAWSNRPASDQAVAQITARIQEGIGEHS